ncbi:hypothetical protein COU76_01255 [Candidatus Peregrinibacteria bacterium CG10_big_fil_rev_8_21_14_0_10_49_10]|nr:MAG: hypothetical protein COU76_01255 [Candidatus Peregrinibacteria bacterium CG10_big_fil_rev_8_21_14_0_10_49_10]
MLFKNNVLGIRLNSAKAKLIFHLLKMGIIKRMRLLLGEYQPGSTQKTLIFVLPYPLIDCFREAGIEIEISRVCWQGDALKGRGNSAILLTKEEMDELLGMDASVS